MKKIIVVAKSTNNVIGDSGNLLWHLPADLKHFYNIIEGKWLLSGRKSYESDQGSDIFYKGAGSIVVTRQPDYVGTEPNTYVAHSLLEAYQIAQKQKVKELLILGGGEVYRQSIKTADELIVTEVHDIFVGDAIFPKIDPKIWIEKKRINCKKDKKNWYDYSFVWYERLVKRTQ